LLAKKAKNVCVAYEWMERFFEPSKIVFTGNPVRKELLGEEEKRKEGYAYYGLDPKKKKVLVTGGSLGAGTLNKMVKAHLSALGEREDIQVLWQCGGYYYDQLSRELGECLPSCVKLLAFLKRMDLAYACADIVVARAGAGTISELCLLEKAAILVPSPNVAEDHQTKNAMALVNKQAALMIKDAEAVERFMPVLSGLLEEEGVCRGLSENIARLAIRDSDEKIAAEILKLIR